MGAFASDLKESLDSGQLHFHTWGAAGLPAPCHPPFCWILPPAGSSWSGPRVGRCRAGDTAKRQEVPVFHPLADHPLGVHSQTRCQLWRP